MTNDIMSSSNEALWIIFLVCISISSTIIGLVMSDMTLVFAGVATIMLTTVLLLGMVDQFGKTLRSYLP